MTPPLPPMRRVRPPATARNLSREEKIELISRGAPKMYYTPEEFPCLEEYTRLHFSNFDIVGLNIDKDKNIISEMRICTIDYKKLHFINSVHEYLMVQADQEGKFRELFLGESKERKYI